LNREFFGVNAVGSRSFEHLHTPIGCALHGGSAGNTAADFVGELAQIAFEGRRLQRRLYYVIGVAGFRRGIRGYTNCCAKYAYSNHFPDFHMR
jgi:hypothetical protein